jgi:hypothetical protein
MLVNNIVNIVTPFICLQQLVQKFIICEWKPKIREIVIKSNILLHGEGVQKDKISCNCVMYIFSTFFVSYQNSDA